MATLAPVVCRVLLQAGTGPAHEIGTITVPLDALGQPGTPTADRNEFRHRIADAFEAMAAELRNDE